MKLALKSDVLKNSKINHINNNIDLDDLDFVKKYEARNILNITSNKQIILYGAQNPQSKRKGWKIFLNALKKIDKKKYFLLILWKFLVSKIS